MKKKLILILLLFVSYKINAQSVSLKIGQEAPAINFNKCLDKNLAADFYKNKIIVIDFWATWCAPCIASFPHFNALSAKFKGSNVFFATITDEPEATALTFFKRTQKKIDRLRLIDTSRLTGNLFGANAIPFCVVIDQNNKVRWTGNTADLTEQKLKEIIEKPNFNETGEAKDIAQVSTKILPSSKPITHLKFIASKGVENGSQSGSWSGSTATDFYFMDRGNIKLGDFLGELTGFSRSARFTTNDTTKLRQTVNISYSSPLGKGYENFAADFAGKFVPKAPRTNYLISQLQYAFNFKFTITEKINNVYELIIVDREKLDSFKSLQKGHASFSDDFFPKFEIVGYKLKAITQQLESSFKKIIVVNFVDNDNYDLSLDISDLKMLNKSLAFHGLQLKEVNTTVKMVDVNFN